MARYVDVDNAIMGANHMIKMFPEGSANRETFETIISFLKQLPIAFQTPDEAATIPVQTMAEFMAENNFIKNTKIV